ncbi:uncharacterized protein HMPREF1541_01449 [Cyphellophora europaea CBS 101466]|uniref:t-SNARE coiled-coil homology domain-containing protein n=1 Tax=Cyphellophora europaea (strain CBS 101466) TaxID=1220924 RepID=W2SEY8_CYPE1|nr:uncharacterized protein HMPREF1541_01449 [Cyphellophora europaea CBS 101466]ETN47257.1 hypothetical protein HMPREF1541_01449 [Cyphellophora europaea CBS 101466]
MDITPALSAILVQSHSAKAISQETKRLTQTLDAFLKEAYQINSSLNSLLTYLRAIRQPYLSSALPPRRSHQAASTGVGPLQDIPTHLTDPQRTAIDESTSSLLRDLNGSIVNLSSAADLQHDTASKMLQKKYGRPTSILLRWAAGSDGPDRDAGKSDEQIQEEGRVRTTTDFRSAVLWYLRMKLEVAARTQGGMVDQRVERERHKQLSRLSDVRNKGIRSTSLPTKQGNGEDGGVGDTGDSYGAIDLRGHDRYDPTHDSSNGDKNALQLSEEQVQLFETENAGLFSHFNEQLSKITVAEKSLLEISSLQQTLLGHLSVQGEQIESLVDNAAQTGEDLKKGNKELKRAGERGSTAKMVFWGTAGLCGFLVTWDLIF